MQLKVINVHFLSIKQLQKAYICCISGILFSESLNQNTDVNILMQYKKFKRPE